MNRSDRQRTQYPPATRAALVAEFRSSGETQKEFARRHGLKWTTFRNWLYGRTRPSTVAPLPEVRFQEVEIGPLLPVSPWAAEVSLGNGTVVRLQAGADPAWAQAIIQPLRQGC